MPLIELLPRYGFDFDEDYIREALRRVVTPLRGLPEDLFKQAEAKVDAIEIETGRSTDLFLAWADVLAQAGMAEEALQAYHSSVLIPLQDYQSLIELGIAFLQRAGIDDLPILWSAFGDYFDYVGEVFGPRLGASEVETFSQFHHQNALVRLALEAFGRVWVGYARTMSLWRSRADGAVQPPYEDDVAAILALDGLRSVFQELRDSEGFQITRSEFDMLASRWDDYDGESFETIQLLAGRFTETSGFFRGLDVVSGLSTADAADEYLRRNNQFKRALESLAAEIKLSDSSQTSQVFERFQSLVNQLTASRPEDQIELATQRAQEAVGQSWNLLPEGVRSLLIDGEFLMPVLTRAKRDCFPIILAWTRSVESLFSVLAPEMDLIDRRRLKGPRFGASWAQATIGDYLSLFRDLSRERPPGLPRKILPLGRFEPELNQLNRLRSPSAHRDNKVTRENAEEAYKLLFGPKQILPELAKILLSRS